MLLFRRRRMELHGAAASPQLKACLLVALLLLSGAFVLRGSLFGNQGASSGGFLTRLRGSQAAGAVTGGGQSEAGGLQGVGATERDPGFDESEPLLEQIRSKERRRVDRQSRLFDDKGILTEEEVTQHRRASRASDSTDLGGNGDKDEFLVSSESQAISRLSGADEQALLSDREAAMEMLSRGRRAEQVPADSNRSTALVLVSAPPPVTPLKVAPEQSTTVQDVDVEGETQDLATDVHLLADINDLQRRGVDEAIRPMEHAVDEDSEGVLVPRETDGTVDDDAVQRR
jgi:hypothetical protein